MNPLLAIAFTLIPDLVRLVAGDRAGTLADQVEEAVTAVTKAGTQDAAQKVLDTDPVKKAELQKILGDIALEAAKEQHRTEEEQKRIELEFLKEKLADADRERASQLDELRASMESVEAARQSYLELANTKSPFAWVMPILSIIITVGFIYFVYALMNADNSSLSENQVFNIALGALAAAFSTVIGYHFGSSVGSKDKDSVTRTLVADNAANRQAVASAVAAQTLGPAVAPREQLANGAVSRAPSSELGVFAREAPMMMKNLIDDFGLKDFQAAGIMGNIGHECAGFRLMQEVKPKSGRGGLGMCQWTGPRRVAFEKWLSDRGLDVTSFDGNYGFLQHELQTTESKSVVAVQRATDLRSATEQFMRVFERPAAATARLDRRLNWASLALKAYRDV